mmetsp:Transcript_20787/g.65068  ORF Transcript_20787/g.65068 Transcript_20787/m.65068 type:complete len:219 (+) Transcript_20787:1-657(+)
MRSAPALAAAAAVSASRTPQTLQSARGGGRPSSSCASPAGESARIRDSPTRTPHAPTSARAVTSERVATPERARRRTLEPLGTSAAQREVVVMSTSKVWRLRLLTPITRAPASSATRISPSLAASTRGSMPRLREKAMSDDSSAAESAATMRSAVSAPCARASSSWYSSTMKSLRSTHTSSPSPPATSAARTRARSSSEPLNHDGSVSTEMVQAPASA